MKNKCYQTKIRILKKNIEAYNKECNMNRQEIAELKAQNSQLRVENKYLKDNSQQIGFDYIKDLIINFLDLDKRYKFKKSIE